MLLGGFIHNMQTKLLIKQLEALVKDHEPHVEILGEHEIVIDSFKYLNNGTWEYAGFSPNIVVHTSSDLCYQILTASETWITPNDCKT